MESEENLIAFTYNNINDNNNDKKKNNNNIRLDMTGCR